MKLRAGLAILAMALQALWPLIAQARPATLVPVCTVGGETHYTEIPGGPSPADKHCELCFMGAALPVAETTHALEASNVSAPRAWSFQEKTFFLVDADARAPPVLPMVIHTNHSRRTEGEKAFALRAARSALGGGVVRFRVLLA